MAFLLFMPTIGRAEEDNRNWGDVRSDLIEEILDKAAAAEADRASTSRQVEAPAVASNSTSLLDRTAAPDLLGIAMNLAGLSGDLSSGGDGEDANSVAIATTAYAFKSALMGRDPLNPLYYCRDRRWRNVSFHASYDDVNDENSSGDEVNHATTFGAKVTIPTGRDACSFELDNDLLVDAAVEDEGLAAAVDLRVCQLLHLPADATSCVVAIEKMWNEDRDRLKSIDPADLADIVQSDMKANLALHSGIAAAVEEVRTAPQFAVSIDGRLEEGEATTDVYRAAFVWEIGLKSNSRWKFGGNVAAEYDDRDQDPTAVTDEDDGYGVSVAALMEYKIERSRFNFFGGSRAGTKEPVNAAIEMPVRWVTSVKGEWKSEVEDNYSVQTKVVIPITKGLDMPISVTYASNPELIDEDEVRGQVGFTLDTSRLLDLL